MSKRVWWLVGLVVAGLILIGLLWPAKSPDPVGGPVKPPGRPVVKFVQHLKRPLAEAPVLSAPLVVPPAETNAANIYRQAIALYESLSLTNKEILRDWQTNVDLAVEAELCGQLRPICALLQQAALVTNCDWGIGPLEPTTPLPHLAVARSLGRAAIWSS